MIKGTDDYNLIKEGTKVKWLKDTGTVIGFACDTVRGSCEIMIGIKWEDGAEGWGYTGADIKKGTLVILDWEA